MSLLAEKAQEYLVLRRSLGHKLDEHGRRLPSLVAYLEQAGDTTVTIEAALAWALAPGCGPDSSVPARRMSIARGSRGSCPGSTRQPGCRRSGSCPAIAAGGSHTSTARLTSRLMSAAGAIPTPLRAATYRALIGLLAATGMRVGEAIRLSRADIDWDDGVLVIRETKFGICRFLHIRTMKLCCAPNYVADGWGGPSTGLSGRRSHSAHGLSATYFGWRGRGLPLLCRR